MNIKMRLLIVALIALANAHAERSFEELMTLRDNLKSLQNPTKEEESILSVLNSLEDYGSPRICHGGYEYLRSIYLECETIRASMVDDLLNLLECNKDGLILRKSVRAGQDSGGVIDSHQLKRVLNYFEIMKRESEGRPYATKKNYESYKSCETCIAVRAWIQKKLEKYKEVDSDIRKKSIDGILNK